MNSGRYYQIDPSHADPKRVKREREKARQLKATGWWKAKIALGECHYCLKQVGSQNLTMDHIVPIARGGESVRSNVVASCKECNSKKKLDTPVDQILRQLAAERGEAPGQNGEEDGPSPEMGEPPTAIPRGADDVEDDLIDDSIGNRFDPAPGSPGGTGAGQSIRNEVGVSLWGSDQTQYFFSLSPEKVLEAVESKGLTCTGRCYSLNSFENRVYDVELEGEEVRSADRQPSGLAGATQPAHPIPAVQPEYFRGRIQSSRKVIKFYRPGRWTEAQILEEHAFLSDLQEAEIPVIAPEKFPDGRTLHQNADGIWFALFPKFGGRAPDELTTDQLLQVGRLLARIHGVGACRDAPHRLKLDADSYGRSNLRFLVAERCLPRDLETDYICAVELVCKRVDELIAELGALKFQRIHGDCHLGNLLWTGAGAAFLDFDDMVRGPVVQDIWMVCPGRDPQALNDREVLIEGYEQMRPFDRRQLRLVEGLRALRMIHYSAWIARRWSDPAFPAAFPHFGTVQYWSDELSSLREQLEVL